jgi:hypothetical protein
MSFLLSTSSSSFDGHVFYTFSSWPLKEDTLITKKRPRWVLRDKDSWGKGLTSDYDPAVGPCQSLCPESYHRWAVSWPSAACLLLHTNLSPSCPLRLVLEDKIKRQLPSGGKTLTHRPWAPRPVFLVFFSSLLIMALVKRTKDLVPMIEDMY